ncbi:MAG: hypothetical protein CL927_02325 [Deltaproteobacteria bacterium]|nr:hypothetical protein [Deltaproteobacteria bacterium]
MTTTSAVDEARPSVWGVAALAALVAAGLGTAGAAGVRGGDFVHLWLGGHAWIIEGPGGIYDPSVHRALLEQAYSGAVPSELWAGRNDRFGAFFYPPPAALAYGLWGSMPVLLAGTVHAVVSFIGVLFGGLLVARWLRVSSIVALLVVLTTPAFFHNHVLGQNGGWSFLVLAAAGLALCRGRDVWAGVVLGLLVCKPSWLLAVFWVPICLGRWRTLAAMLCAASMLCVGSAVMLGPEPWQHWWSLLPGLAALSTAGDYPLDLQYSLWGLGRRVLGLGWAGDGLGAVLSAGVCGATMYLLRSRTGALLQLLALGWCAASLVNLHLHPYDVTGGVFAVLAVWSVPSARRLAWVALGVHHGGQALEGLTGTGWAVAPATVGLVVAWGALAWVLYSQRHGGLDELLPEPTVP